MTGSKFRHRSCNVLNGIATREQLQLLLQHYTVFLNQIRAAYYFHDLSCDHYSDQTDWQNDYQEGDQYNNNSTKRFIPLLCIYKESHELSKKNIENDST